MNVYCTMCYMYTYKLSKKKAKERNFHSHRCASARLLNIFLVVFDLSNGNVQKTGSTRFSLLWSRPSKSILWIEWLSCCKIMGFFVNYIASHGVCTRIVMKMRKFAKVHPIWRKLPKNVFARKLFLAKTIRDVAVIVKILHLHCFCKLFVGYYVTILIFAEK